MPSTTKSKSKNMYFPSTKISSKISKSKNTKYFGAMIAAVYLIAFFISKSTTNGIVSCHPKYPKDIELQKSYYLLTQDCAKKISFAIALHGLYMVLGILAPIIFYFWLHADVTKSILTDQFAGSILILHAIFGVMFSIFNFVVMKLYYEKRYGEAVNYVKTYSNIGILASFLFGMFIMIGWEFKKSWSIHFF